MQASLLNVGPWLGVAMGALVLVAAVVAVVGHLGQGRRILVAAIRAVVQLGLVSLVITAILGSLPLTAVFVLAMYTIATWTAGRRATRHRSGWWAALPIVAGTAPVIVALLATGLLPPKAIAVIPVSGILIGGAMTATAQAARRALDELRDRHGEYEAGLSIGMMPRDAGLEVCRPSASQALIPALDQTRTVGLVTLPGAFVGMLMAGAHPLDAGATQLFVLVGLLAVEVVAVVVALELVVRGRIVPVTEDAAVVPTERGSWLSRLRRRVDRTRRP
ncbi:MAG: ABC transporter permease [Streptosporangiales bacterium]|nr:ABC transporter permease [Streptosporangiales bacterium]